MTNPNKRNIYITREDMIRLRSLISAVKSTRDDLSSLRAELDQAQVMAPEEIPRDVITMNSQARLRDKATREIMTFTLVFPENASIEHNRISVLAPIGTAMLGQRQGSEKSGEWRIGEQR